VKDIFTHPWVLGFEKELKKNQPVMINNDLIKVNKEVQNLEGTN
jgi:hypothetical protein